MSALADTATSKSSNWGASLGFAPSGVTVGGNWSQSSAISTSYTNAPVTAGGIINAVSGRDMRIAGANLQAGNIYLDVGRDLTILSRQNTASSSSQGYNFSVTFGPNGVPTGGSVGFSTGSGSRTYTDTPTSIVANHILNVYTNQTTYLLGAVLNSKSGQLKLDTGNFVFDNFADKDLQKQISLQVGTESLGGSYYYRNKQGLTYATVGKRCTGPTW